MVEVDLLWHKDSGRTDHSQNSIGIPGLIRVLDMLDQNIKTENSNPRRQALPTNS
jgi:hypothetical protein